MRNIILTTAAASIALAAPALAQRGGGIGAGVGGSVGVGIGSSMGGTMGNAGHATGAGSTIGADHGTVHSDTGVSTRTEARQNSQGPAHAADRALDRANQNSVLSGSASAGTSLTNLRAGLTVRDSTGATLGTISRINRSADGTVRNVLVKSAKTGRKTLALAPNTLTVNGDVVTTTRLSTSSGRR